jgi:HK97 family phage portal protein
MSIWQKALDLVGYTPNIGGNAPQVANSVPSSLIVRGSDMFDVFTGGGAGGLPVPSEKTALQISTVYACVNLIAGAIASLPIHIYRQDPTGERDRLPNEDLWWILNEQFVPRWSAASGWEFLIASLLLKGDAFAEIDRDRNGVIKGLIPIHPDRVTVAVTPDARRNVYIVEPDPLIFGSSLPRQVLDQDDVLHIAGFGFDGIRGLPPLRHQLRMAGSVSMATQDYAARFFANSARPDLVLQSDQAISKEAIDNLRAQLDERHNGTANAHRPMVLTGGLKAEIISIPVEDLQLLQLRQFQVEEIARIYGIPPFMIGHTTNTTAFGSGMEAMGVGFVRYGLRPHLNKVENEINRKLFRTASRVAVIDTTELERADTKSLFEAYRVALGRAGEPGFMTTQEVRERLSLKREPDGSLNQGTPNGQTDQPPAG